MEINIYNNNLSAEIGNECNVIDKHIYNIVYRSHTGSTVFKHNKVLHLNENADNKLNKLMSRLEDITKGKAGTFNRSKIEFKLKDDTVPYNTRTYYIT